MKTYQVENTTAMLIVDADSPEQAEVLLRAKIARYLSNRNRSLWASFAKAETKTVFYSECSRLLRTGFRVREAQLLQSGLPADYAKGRGKESYDTDH